MNYPHARKTYAVCFRDEKGRYAEEYFQNKREAQKRANQLGIKQGKASLSYWVDGAEMVRLARLGFVYDTQLGRCVHSEGVSEFVQAVDAMSEREREVKFLDYRKFRTLTEALAYREERRKGRD